MKHIATHIIILLLLLTTGFIPIQVQAQTGTYSNDWIDFDQPHYKIQLTNNGLYRIDYETLASTDLPLDAESLAIFYLGEEIPIYTSSEGMLETGDYIEFVGKAENAKFETALFEDPEWQMHTYFSLFYDTAAYYLTTRNSGSNPRYTTMDNNLTGDLPEKEDYFTYTSHRVLKNIFNGGEPFSAGGINNYFSDFNDGEGIIGLQITEGQTQGYNITTQFINYDAPVPARVSTCVLGQSDELGIPDHHLLVEVEGNVYVDDIYEGYAKNRYDFEVPTLELDEPQTNVAFTSVADISSVDKNSVSFIEITYPRYFNFSNARRFFFELDNNEDKYIEIEGFSGEDNPILYDYTHQQRFVPVIEDNVYKFFIPQVEDGQQKRQLLFSNTDNTCPSDCSPPCIVANCGTFLVNSFTPINFIDYSEAANQGNYILLTHPRLMQGDINHVERYADYRASIQGGSHTPVIVDINQLYEQFACGQEKNPLSIRYFIDYIIDNWSITPEYLLLIGKGISYHRTVLNSPQFSECLIPTYGHQPSDIMLSATDNDNFVPRLATGRIPAQQSEQVGYYLDKLIAMEEVDLCSKEDRLWRKDALHLAGGFSLSEAESYRNYLDEYKLVYEDTSFSGRVPLTVVKSSDEVIEVPELEATINNGLGMISFFGHSDPTTWDVSIQTPDVYSNNFRNPFMLSISCYVGNVFNNTTFAPSMVEDFILIEERGAIGFLATVFLGYPPYMDNYIDRFYQNFCLEMYHQPIGKCIQKTAEQMAILYPESNLTGNMMKLTTQEYSYAGDPAFIFSAGEKPELYIDESSIFYEPQQITTNIDSFAVNVVVNNLGKGTAIPFDITVNRGLPDGGTQSTTQTFITPTYVDTFTIYLATSPSDTLLVAGENDFEIIIDSNNQVEEDCETNNSTNTNNFVFSDLLVPIAPCDFSIVCGGEVELAASTGQPILEVLPYKMEIDTTRDFSNPLAQYTLNSESGVITWNPDIEFEDGKVYYWRSSQLSPNGDAFNWQSSSFLYSTDPDCKSGWNQSHYQQFLQDRLSQLQIDSNTQIMDFTGVNNNLRVTNHRFSYVDIRTTLNLTSQLAWQSCLKASCTGGLTFIPFRPASVLDPMTSVKQNDLPSCDGRGTYGNIQCGNGERPGFEFHTGTNEQLNAMINFMENEIPNGYYVLVYSVFDHRLSSTDPSEPIYDYLPQINNFFEDIGAAAVNTISSDSTAFIAFGRKGSDGLFPAEVVINEDFSEIFEMDIDILGRDESGTILSTNIGPAQTWGSVDLSSFALENEPNDTFQLNILGKHINGNTDLLFTTETNSNDLLDISSIDANTYPVLQLEMLNRDAISFTPNQLDYWRVYYDMATELAINQMDHFVFLSDTLTEGEPVHLEIAIANQSSADADSLLVAYTIIDNNNNEIGIDYPRHQPIAAGSSEIITFDYSTEGLSGNNTLLVEINPNNDQLEKFRFNNVMLLNFFVDKDKINPILDVTFDGRHILDGDLVSARPQINITAKDENRFLALNDTSDLNIFFRYPDANGEPSDPLILVSFADASVTFIPASSSEAEQGNNAAKVEIEGNFTQSGTYELVVESKDRSNNSFAGSANYSIQFKIETRPMVSNVYNYPNPFTSNTRFIFTLTGYEIPEMFKIQIMTVSGKVVREIYQDELGPIYIGDNITEFAWDGTDTYGNPLGNGLYLYRVVTKLNGENMEQYDTAGDDAFKNNIGKMYLMR